MKQGSTHFEDNFEKWMETADFVVNQAGIDEINRINGIEGNPPEE